MTTRDRPREEGETQPALVGLDAPDADAVAVEFLGAIPWDGVDVDPDTTAAGVFLATL